MNFSAPSPKTKIPPAIWALGFVSLFMDMSSELIHSLLPVFMVTMLGASMTAVGVVEGVAEAVALITKVFSGTLSDALGRRKLLTVIGYGFAGLTKPFFPLAESVGTVMAARFADRIGKGIRGAPRDALIGDLAPPEIRGACFGLRQSLDTIGAVLGPAVAILGMMLLAGDMRAVMWIGVAPAFIALAILVFFVREPGRHRAAKPAETLRLRDIRHAGGAYWGLVAFAGILTLARFSEAFLILKAQDTGVALTWIPLVAVLMNIVYAASSYPAGILSDRGGRFLPLFAGIGFLLAADLVLAFAGNFAALALGVVFWGLHMGLTQGLLAAMVADSAPPALRGTAYGVFNLACGVAMLAASVIAGLLWDHFGAAATFLAGAGFAGVSLIGLVLLRRRSGAAA